MGEHYEGVPARDLTADEFEALTDDQKRDVVSTEPYALYDAVEPTSDDGEAITVSSDLPLPDSEPHAIVNPAEIEDRPATVTPIEHADDDLPPATAGAAEIDAILPHDDDEAAHES
jgi:hypothetical protein